MQGSTIISISVDKRFGSFKSNNKQVPPLKMKGISALANASSNPKANSDFLQDFDLLLFHQSNFGYSRLYKYLYQS